MTYVMRFVDAGIADTDYQLLPEDVEAILADQGPSILSERSMQNISIVDHLLRKRPQGAKTVISNIEIGDDEELFVDRYLNAGREKAAFVRQLAQTTRSVFGLVNEASALEDLEKVELFDVAARSVNDKIAYDYPSDIAPLLRDQYAAMPALAQGTDDSAIRRVLQLFTATGAIVADLSSLPRAVQVAFGGTRAYALTKRNLEAVTGQKDLSLDSLMRADPEISNYARDNMNKYLRIVSKSSTTGHTVTSASLFVEVLGDADRWEKGDESAFIAHAGPACIVDALPGLPMRVWPDLVQTRRVPMSWVNVLAYVDAYDGVTPILASALNDVSSISDSADGPVEDRVRVALAILNSDANELGASKRVHLAFYLKPGLLNVADIAPYSGTLVGSLIDEELVADDENAFSARLMVDWETQAYTMLISRNFKTFIGPSVLQERYVNRVFEDERFADLHAPLRDALSTYPGAMSGAFAALAELAIAGKIELYANDIGLAQDRGLNRTKVVALLAASAARVSHDELVALLSSVGGAWAKVTKRGFGVTSIPMTPGAGEVLDRLRREGVVSKIRPEDGRFKVSLRRP